MREKIGEVSLLANRYYKVDITGNNYGPGDLKFKFSPPGHVDTWTEKNDTVIAGSVKVQVYKAHRNQMDNQRRRVFLHGCSASEFVSFDPSACTTTPRC
jgi:hypothetical protein